MPLELEAGEERYLSAIAEVDQLPLTEEDAGGEEWGNGEAGGRGVEEEPAASLRTVGRMVSTLRRLSLRKRVLTPDGRSAEIRIENAAERGAALPVIKQTTTQPPCSLSLSSAGGVSPRRPVFLASAAAAKLRGREWRMMARENSRLAQAVRLGKETGIEIEMHEEEASERAVANPLLPSPHEPSQMNEKPSMPPNQPNNAK